MLGCAFDAAARGAEQALLWTRTLIPSTHHTGLCHIPLPSGTSPAANAFPVSASQNHSDYRSKTRGSALTDLTHNPGGSLTPSSLFAPRSHRGRAAAVTRGRITEHGWSTEKGQAQHQQTRTQQAQPGCCGGRAGRGWSTGHLPQHGALHIPHRCTCSARAPTHHS